MKFLILFLRLKQKNLLVNLKVLTAAAFQDFSCDPDFLFGLENWEGWLKNILYLGCTDNWSCPRRVLVSITCLVVG